MWGKIVKARDNYRPTAKFTTFLYRVAHNCFIDHLRRNKRHAGNTPFRLYKQNQHEGGISSPLIVHWPDGIEGGGEIRQQYHHITDIAPTILDVTGTPFFEEIDGEEQMDMDGVSMQYSFNDASAPTQHPEQYYELFGNRAIYQDGWKAVTIHAGRMPWNLNRVAPFEDDVWELYNLNEDFSEAVNLADENPEKLAELQARWEELAWENNVFPLYDDMVQRIAKQQDRLFGDQEEFVYFFPGAVRIAETSGGFFGSGKISDAEAALLDRLENPTRMTITPFSS